MTGYVKAQSYCKEDNVLDKWTMDKEVRHALGEDTLPAWKEWLKSNEVSLHSFLKDYYPGNLEDMIRRLKISEVDEWLFDFIHTKDGLKQASIITPKHPEQSQREDYNPFAQMIGKIQRQSLVQNMRTQNVGAVTKTLIPDPKDLMPEGQGRSVKCDSGIRITNLIASGSVSIYEKTDQDRYLKAEFGLEEKDLKSKTIPAGSKMVIFSSDEAETLIEFANETTVRSVEFGRDLSSQGDWISFDDGGSEVVVIGNEPADLSCDQNEWTEKMRYERDVYNADYILTHN